jgi:DNA-binding CsgD family transcriptional regulator
MARHLGLRLVAEAALADGWGDPATWLRAAESYFHTHSVAAVDDACRRLLRQAGMTIPPRRAGTENLPAEIRVKRITVREYEVLRLVAARLSNTEIGRQLYISPRTVEKHVASLIGKADAAGRAALSDFAARVCGAPARSP